LFGALRIYLVSGTVLGKEMVPRSSYTFVSSAHVDYLIFYLLSSALKGVVNTNKKQLQNATTEMYAMRIPSHFFRKCCRMK
jgi:hypothetical protein